MKAKTASHPRFLASLLVIISLLLAHSGSAANLTNDFNAGTAPNPADGSGAWMTANNWWDGTANLSWSAANVAYFGAGVDGTYDINVGGVPSPAAQNLRFTASGYTLTNDMPTDVVITATTYQVAVGSGKTATIGTNVTLRESGAQYFYVGPSVKGA